MIDNLFNRLLQQLILDSYFSDFKFRKKDNSLIKKTSVGFEAIELQYWKGFDLKRNELALVVKPLYLKRFDVLHKWFEKFSFKSLHDQKNNFSIGFDGKMLSKSVEFYFLFSGAGFERDFGDLKVELINNSRFVFNKYSDIKALYDYYVEPILNKEVQLPEVGADWIFEYLTLTKLVKNACFDDVKNLLEAQINKMYNKNEPNVIEYYPRYNEIVNYLSSQQLE